MAYRNNISVQISQQSPFSPKLPLVLGEKGDCWEKHAAGLYKEDHQMKFEYIVRYRVCCLRRMRDYMEKDRERTEKNGGIIPK